MEAGAPAHGFPTHFHKNATMFLRSSRFGASALILVALFATPSTASWFGDWFGPREAEELPTPEADAAASSPVPMLVPPLQSPPTVEIWDDDAETVYPDAAEMHVPPGAEYVPNVDIWGDDETQDYPPSLELGGIGGAEAPQACCEPPTIRYWNHPLLALIHGNSECDERQTAILQIEGDCCPIEIPVAVPSCCVDAPECDARHGLLGRSTYEYRWPCGYRVKVVRWGDSRFVVHTYNSWGGSCLGRKAWL